MESWRKKPHEVQKNIVLKACYIYNLEKSFELRKKSTGPFCDM